MYMVFYRTMDVFAAEEILHDNSIKTSIEPTPVQDKAYCGVCVEIELQDYEKAKDLLNGYEHTAIL